MTWLIAEQFNARNVAEFRALHAAGRLANIGYCLPTGRTGDFDSIAEAELWIAAGKNVYADVQRLALDYSDGGELRCGACGKTCFKHFADGDRIDIGECCAGVK